MSFDDDFRAAADAVRSAASGLAVPDEAAARRHQRRRTRASAVVAGIAVLGIGGLAAAVDRPSELVAGSSYGAGSVVPGSSPGSVPGPVGTVPGIAPVPVPSTSTSMPSASTTLPTPSTTADPGFRLVGTYDGTEHIGTGGEGCPDLEHHLEANIAAGDGTTWTYTSGYCGTIRPDGWWQGSGSIILVDPDGAQLWADWSKATPPGTPGEPFDAPVRGGTRRFEGVRGTCSFTVSIEKPRPFVQRQSGTIDCTVSR